MHTRTPSAQLAAEALALADLQVLQLTCPGVEDLASPRSDAYWHTCAWAYAAPVRAARRDALAALAQRSAAGAPQPANLTAVDHEFGGADTLVEAVATFDLVGLLGLGPSGAARALASVEALAAVARLERELWAARFTVDRARVRYTAAWGRHRRLLELADEARRDRRRLEILHDRGRLSEAAWTRSTAAQLAVAAEASRAADDLTLALADLVTASGLPPRHPSLRFDSLLELRESLALSLPPFPGGTSALETHPELRAARVAVAVSEARLRTIAAAAWPGLQIGPHLGFPGDGVNLGGVLQLTLPFPSQWRGALEAAEHERARSLEELEEVVLARLNRLHTAHAQHTEALRRYGEQSTAVAGAAEMDWRTTGLRLRVRLADTDEWSQKLERHARSMLQPVDDCEAAALAALDYLEAQGPRAGVPEYTPPIPSPQDGGLRP